MKNLDNTHPFSADPAWGWSSDWENKWKNLDSGTDSHDRDLVPARIIRQDQQVFALAQGPLGDQVQARIRGKALEELRPILGDWVIYNPQKGWIEGLIPRASLLSRGQAGGTTGRQDLLANLDTLFLVFALDGGRNFLVSLLERALVVAWESGAAPVIILNKADLADDDLQERSVLAAENAAFGVPVHLVSAREGLGLEALAAYLQPGKTLGLLGKTGVGKSALANALLGHTLQREGELRRDLQGRHTTTHRVLFPLHGGALLADGPGLRELRLWSGGDGLDASFPEIAQALENCRFRNCRHQGEPGCGVQEALALGEIEPRRFEHYLELRDEVEEQERRKKETPAQTEKRRWKGVSQFARKLKKDRGF